MDSIEYFLIVNPVAGRGHTQRIFPALHRRLQAQKFSMEIRFTSQPEEASELAHEGIQRGFPAIVAVGGDGTIHEVAQGLLGSSATLGVIPTGSGNDFCKAVGIPLDPWCAIETLSQGRLRRVDVGRLERRYFVNGLGIGLDGAVSHRYRRMKLLHGELGYLWGAIHEALRFRAIPIDLRLPDWSYRGSALLTGASNGQYHGGNFKLAPNAKMDDGLLDVYLIRDMHPLRRLLEIPKVRKGTHLSLHEVEMHTAPWVEVTSESALLAHMDGEPFELEPGIHIIEVVPKALEVIAP